MNCLLRLRYGSAYWTLLLAIHFVAPRPLLAEPTVPGAGLRADEVGDDFENPHWQYVANDPKSTRDIDHSDRLPAGHSANRRWYEGVKRGHPDVVRRIETPQGGLLGSDGALLLRSLHTGIPGYPSYQVRQDDFICSVNYRLGGSISVTQSPSCVVRVFLPPVEMWEPRTGTHFGFRAAVDTTVVRTPRYAPRPEQKVYWPGMFIDFRSKKDGFDGDQSYFLIRGDKLGRDFRSKQIKKTGWWTLGMSFTPDGQVHYFAKPGVEDLTREDYLTSQFPYGYRCERFRTFFFNVVNGDNGRTWSTPWVIDDPAMYFMPGIGRRADQQSVGVETVGR